MQAGGDRRQVAPHPHVGGTLLEIEHQRLAANLFGGQGIGVVVHGFDDRHAAQIGCGGLQEPHGFLVRLDSGGCRIEREFHGLEIGRYAGELGRLKIAIVTGWLQARATELRGDVFGGDIETGRRRSAALEQIRGQKGNIGLQVVGGQAAGDLLYRWLGGLGLRGGHTSQEG